MSRHLLGRRRWREGDAIASERVLFEDRLAATTAYPQGFQKHGQWVAENLLAITNPNMDS
jgi:hypothetical protein